MGRGGHRNHLLPAQLATVAKEVCKRDGGPCGPVGDVEHARAQCSQDSLTLCQIHAFLKGFRGGKDNCLNAEGKSQTIHNHTLNGVYLWVV